MISTSSHHQEVITDLLGVNNEDELVVRNAIEEKVTPEKAQYHPDFWAKMSFTKYAQTLREVGKVGAGARQWPARTFL